MKKIIGFLNQTITIGDETELKINAGDWLYSLAGLFVWLMGWVQWPVALLLSIQLLFFYFILGYTWVVTLFTGEKWERVEKNDDTREKT